MKKTAVIFLSFALSALIYAQQRPNDKALVIQTLRCGTLIQPESGQVQHNVLVTIEGERIKQVQENSQAAAGSKVIDLYDHTCLPGLVDAHTHTLLQGDITAEDYDVQLLKQSAAYRAIAATRSARR